MNLQLRYGMLGDTAFPQAKNIGLGGVLMVLEILGRMMPVGFKYHQGIAFNLVFPMSHPINRFMTLVRLGHPAFFTLKPRQLNLTLMDVLICECGPVGESRLN